MIKIIRLLRHFNDQLTQMTERREQYQEKLNDMINRTLPQTSADRLAKALRYEQLTARISELDWMIENLIHTSNLLKSELDQRKKDRRKIGMSDRLKEMY